MIGWEGGRVEHRGWWAGRVVGWGMRVHIGWSTEGRAQRVLGWSTEGAHRVEHRGWRAGRVVGWSTVGGRLGGW